MSLNSYWYDFENAILGISCYPFLDLPKIIERLEGAVQQLKNGEEEPTPLKILKVSDRYSQAISTPTTSPARSPLAQLSATESPMTAACVSGGTSGHDSAMVSYTIFYNQCLLIS